jgi:hypothetical protein
MPCGCPERDDKLVKLKFVGGRGRTHPAGPWVNHKYGFVYVKPSRFVDKNTYPFWEYVDDLSKEELEQYSIDDEFPTEAEFTVTGSTEEDAELTEEETISAGPGLTKLYGVAGDGGIKVGDTFTERDIFTSMTVPQLQQYIVDNGGKADRRWKKARLVKEALKLQ